MSCFAGFAVFLCAALFALWMVLGRADQIKSLELQPFKLKVEYRQRRSVS